MHRFRATIVLVLAILLSLSICSAQQASSTAVPNLIRYSATLKDAQSAASVPSTAVGVTFSIYKQQDGGAAVWMETQNVTPDSNGQYSVILGSTTATGLPDDLFSQQEQRWLGVQVQGQAEQARVLLVSVPYAFKAHEAETLGGLPPSAFVKAPTSDAADGTSVNALSTAGKTASSRDAGRKSAAGKKTLVSNVVNGPCIPPLAPPLTPALGYIPMFYDASPSMVICNSVIYQTQPPLLPYIGIGTTTPGARLDVAGDINAAYGKNSYQIGLNTVLSILGTDNLFVGVGAGLVNQPETGIDNTFIGNGTGGANRTGSNNTFTGSGAGSLAKSHDNNTFYGYWAGKNNDQVGNSFFGYQAGRDNTTGVENTFLGFNAGVTNAKGSHNTFLGDQAGSSNGLNADNNTFTGASAGLSNVSGDSNVFNGTEAGRSNLGGVANTSIGYQAGKGGIDGSYNTFIGYQAGSNAQLGHDNIYIGAFVSSPSSEQVREDRNIRIGLSPEDNNEQHRVTDTYIGGIWNENVGTIEPQTVCADRAGKIWSTGGTCKPSSRRFKENVLDMGDRSSKLFQLRPVTFFYKPQYEDGSHLLQYGLIAEEVAEVYPEMVVYDKGGQVYSVKYQLLAPMLLNELQKQHTVVAAQQDVIKTQQGQIQTQGQQIADLQQRLTRLESLIAK